MWLGAAARGDGPTRPDAIAQLERAGSRILLQEDGWVVALRETR